ncbi:MAG: PAS domain S-box protein, partial [Leptospiraceae bacterium]|nr:PAS domain S-box protein [Leptospiraceae bacterium]
MDIKTLFISIFVVSATGLMLSIFIYRKVSYVFQGSIYWLLAVISIFSSTFFFSMVKTFPAFFAVHIGNTLFLSSPILITISFHRFFFQTNPRIPIFTGIFLIIVFNILAPFASVKERIILFSAFFTILWTFPGLVLITLKEDAFNKLLAGTFFLIAGISLYRAVGTYLGPDIDNLLVSNITQQISIVSILVTWVIIITAFLLLINSHAIDRIAEEERKLKIAVEQNPQSISISDLKGIILSVNKAFCDTSGYKQEELIGQNYRILKSGVHNPQFYEEFWKIILQGKPWIGEICNKKKDGTIFWEKATVSPIFSKQNEVTGFFAIKEDITRQKHLEKFKNRMESLMRHDLKTPLNGIINFPDIILDEGNLSSEQIEYLQFIKKSGKMMLDQ